MFTRLAQYKGWSDEEAAKYKEECRLKRQEKITELHTEKRELTKARFNLFSRYDSDREEFQDKKSILAEIDENLYKLRDCCAMCALLEGIRRHKGNIEYGAGLKCWEYTHKDSDVSIDNSSSRLATTARVMHNKLLLKKSQLEEATWWDTVYWDTAFWGYYDQLNKFFAYCEIVLPRLHPRTRNRLQKKVDDCEAETVKLNP